MVNYMYMFCYTIFTPILPRYLKSEHISNDAKNLTHQALSAVSVKLD